MRDACLKFAPQTLVTAGRTGARKSLRLYYFILAETNNNKAFCLNCAKHNLRKNVKVHLAHFLIMKGMS